MHSLSHWFKAFGKSEWITQAVPLTPNPPFNVHPRTWRHPEGLQSRRACPERSQGIMRASPRLPRRFRTFHSAGIFLRTCATPAIETVFFYRLKRHPGRVLWKICIVFAAIGSSKPDINPWRFICSRKPLESGRGRNRRRSGYAFVRNVRFRWPWDLRRKARSTSLPGT